MIIKRFTITSKLGTDIKSCTKNEEQTLELLKRVFGNDKRVELVKVYFEEATLDHEPFYFVSPLGYISIKRVK